MPKKKTYKPKIKPSSVKEPTAPYRNLRIQFFKSFEEANVSDAKERSEISYDNRMIYIEELRKRVFNKYLLPDGSWSPIEKVFKIMSPYTNEISQ